jgi:hypothetical protein
MEQWRKDVRKEAIIIDIDFLVPADHLLRKIEKVMDSSIFSAVMLPQIPQPPLPPDSTYLFHDLFLLFVGRHIVHGRMKKYQDANIYFESCTEQCNFFRF